MDATKNVRCKHRMEIANLSRGGIEVERLPFVNYGETLRMIQIREYEAERRGHTAGDKCNMIPWANIRNDIAMVKLRRMKHKDINHRTTPMFSKGAGASTPDPGVKHTPG